MTTKSPSYTKAGSGRIHNFNLSERTFKSNEPRGNKLQRKAIRKHVGLKHITKSKGEYSLKHK
jgi:hypothetical protein